MIWRELREPLIFLGLRASSDREVLEILGDAMAEAGYAKASYAKELIRREKQFPTGIDIQGIGIAIPHTDAAYVNRDGIALAVLEEPVGFAQMGEEDGEVAVRIVFLLAVKNPAAHLKRLQSVLKVIQDREILARLLKAKTPDEVIRVIREKEGEA